MNRLWTAVVVASGWLAAATAASAQDRGFNGIFGGREETASDQKLDLLTTLVQAYDDNLLAENGLTSPGAPVLGGYYTMFTGSMEYAWTGRRVQIGATGSSAWRYFSEVGRVQGQSHSGGLGLSAELPSRVTLFVNQNAAYSPSYLYGLFPTSATHPSAGDSQAAAPDYAATDAESYSYQTIASLKRGFTRRGSVSLAADYSRSDFTGSSNPSRSVAGRSDLMSYGVRADFSKAIGRRESIRTGYRYKATEYGTSVAGRTGEHGFEVGFERTKILSASRRAEFGFSLGVSAGEVPVTTAGPEGGEFYGLTGAASMTYQFGRSWDWGVSYRRGVAYVAELTEPVFTDGVSASIGGLLTRGMDLRLAAGYSSGESVLYATSGFDTYTASARSRFAVTRRLGVYLEYLYYFYDFGGNSLVAPGLSPRLERHGVRGGLTLWVPAFRK